MTSPIQPCHDGFRPGWLWSLWDMLKVSAREYLVLGGRLEVTARMLMDADDRTQSPYGVPLSDEQKDALRRLMKDILAECKKLALPVSSQVIADKVKTLPETMGEMDVLTSVINSELQTQLFLFVPPHRAKYYELILPSIITTRFPVASYELTQAADGIATEMYTASVFHCMRAVELGLRAMAQSLNVTFPYPLELAEWGKIVGEIEPKIAELQKGPRSTQRDEDLKFYSEAASQFRHFNNGWRVRAAHARATYEEHQAISVFDHTLNFFLTLSSRLKEPPF